MISNCDCHNNGEICKRLLFALEGKQNVEIYIYIYNIAYTVHYVIVWLILFLEQMSEWHGV